MDAISSTEAAIKRSEEILLKIDSIFLTAGSSSPSQAEAIELIRLGSSALEELRQIAGEAEEPYAFLLQLIESLEASIGLAEEEIHDEE